MSAQPILEAIAVSKSFGGVAALSGVDFEVMPGEVVALVGDNGAGKSTLIKAIAGVQPADSAAYRFEGRPVSIRNASDATRLGISTVYQDLALCDNLDVVGNLFLGHEWLVDGPRRLTGELDEDAMEQRTHELLDQLAVTTLSSPRPVVGALSGGQRQAVAIARALLGRPKVVILDEPTAALGVVQNVFDVADRIVVLRLGRRVATYDRRTTSREAVVAAITGASELTPEPQPALA
jgi:D-xylose transport system ATP-binding protein